MKQLSVLVIVIALLGNFVMVRSNVATENTE